MGLKVLLVGVVAWILLLLFGLPQASITIVRVVLLQIFCVGCWLLAVGCWLLQRKNPVVLSDSLSV